MWLCRFALTAAAVLLGGTAVLRLLAWGSAGPGAVPRWNRLAVVSWSVLLLASVLQLGLTAAQMSDLPLAQAFHLSVLAEVMRSTHFGAVWQVRIALLGVLLMAGVMSAVAQRIGSARLIAVSDVASALLIVAVLASLVATGHAQASEKRVWLLPADIIHATAAGAWPGGLFPLVLLLARARHQVELLPAALTITRRFSRVSVVAVGVLAMSGSLNGYALVGTIHGLWTCLYGRLVVCKAMLFLSMVGLGAMNKRLIEQNPTQNAPAAVRRLWRNVAVECAFAVAVLVATEALAMSTPPPTTG